MESSSDSVTISLNNDPFECGASFRIYDGSQNIVFDIEEISEKLNLKPTMAHLRGPKPHNKNHVYGSSAWLLHSEKSVKSSEPGRHLSWILDQIAHAHSAIREFKIRGFKVEIWLTIRIGHWNTLAVLSPEIIAALQHFDIPLLIDIYDYQDLGG